MRLALSPFPLAFVALAGLACSLFAPFDARADDDGVSRNVRRPHEESDVAAVDDGDAPPTPIAPSVAIGAPQWVRGGSITKGVREAIRARAPLVEACQRDAGGAIPSASMASIEGTMSIRLVVVRVDDTKKALAPGHVESVEVMASEELPSVTRRCIRDAFVGASVGLVGPTPIEALVAMALDPGTTETPLDGRPRSACPAEVDGAMTDGLRAELRERATTAALCFRRAAALGEPATLKGGSLEVQLRIAADGSVCGAMVVGDEFGRASLTSCLVDALSGDYASEPDGAIDVSIPMVFKGT